MRVIVTLGDVIALIITTLVIIFVIIAFITIKIQERIERRNKK